MPDVFHQFQLPCYFLNCYCLFYILYGEIFYFTNKKVHMKNFIMLRCRSTIWINMLHLTDVSFGELQKHVDVFYCLANIKILFHSPVKPRTELLLWTNLWVRILLKRRNVVLRRNLAGFQKYLRIDLSCLECVTERDIKLKTSVEIQWRNIWAEVNQAALTMSPTPNQK